MACWVHLLGDQFVCVCRTSREHKCFPIRRMGVTVKEGRADWKVKVDQKLPISEHRQSAQGSDWYQLTMRIDCFLIEQIDREKLCSDAYLMALLRRKLIIASAVLMISQLRRWAFKWVMRSDNNCRLFDNKSSTFAPCILLKVSTLLNTTSS